MLPIFLLCTNDCGAEGNLPAPVPPCDTEAMQTTGYTFAIVKCDYQFTSLTTQLEWETAITAGDIVIAPKGFWGKPAATVTSFDITCKRKKQVREGQQITFTSNLIVPLTAEEQDFYKTLGDRVDQYRFIPISCNEDGTLDYWVTDEYVENDTTAGESPGHIGTWINPPDNVVVAGLNNLLEWGFTIQLATTGVLCRRRLPNIDTVIEAN